jgi:hypothetical protein
VKCGDFGKNHGGCNMPTGLHWHQSEPHFVKTGFGLQFRFFRRVKRRDRSACAPAPAPVLAHTTGESRDGRVDYGATAGFGAAMARKFAGNGHKVIAAGRRKERLDDLVKELGADKVLPLVLDVTSKESINAGLASLRANGSRSTC